MDSLNDLIKRYLIHILSSDSHSITKNARIVNEPSHLCLSATVAKLEVIQHGVVLLSKPLVGVLNVPDVGAELRSVVGHVHHGDISQISSLFSIATQTLE